MATKADLALVGAASPVGEAMLEFLAERDFPLERLYLLGDGQEVGTKLEFKDRYLRVEPAESFDFSKVRLTLFAEAQPRRDWVEAAVAAGGVAIDGSGAWLDQAEVPTVVAEVNPERLAEHGERGIVAMPSSLATMLAIVLEPLHEIAGIERLDISTYQSVSGLGKAGVEELAGQSARLLNVQSVAPRVFPRQIAFNLLPMVGAAEVGGHSFEELRLARELRKLLGEAELSLGVSAVRVPMFYGEAASVHLTTRSPLGAAGARELLGRAAGLVVLDDPQKGEFPTPVTDAAQQDEVFVGRIREDISHPRGLNFWVVADNVRKGAALNGVLLAELLVRYYL